LSVVLSVELILTIKLSACASFRKTNTGLRMCYMGSKGRVIECLSVHANTSIYFTSDTSNKQKRKCD